MLNKGGGVSSGATGEETMSDGEGAVVGLNSAIVVARGRSA